MNATVQPIATPPAGRSLVVRFADRFSIDADKMITTLKATAFRQRPNRDGSVRECSNEELMMLLTICDRYGLDPFTREIFAFLDVKSGAIIPVVSVDGWIRLINERQELQAIEFTYSPETVEHKGKTCHVWIECVISRSDRSAKTLAAQRCSLTGLFISDSNVTTRVGVTYVSPTHTDRTICTSSRARLSAHTRAHRRY